MKRTLHNVHHNIIELDETTKSSFFLELVPNTLIRSPLVLLAKGANINSRPQVLAVGTCSTMWSPINSDLTDVQTVPAKTATGALAVMYVPVRSWLL